VRGEPSVKPLVAVSSQKVLVHGHPPCPVTPVTMSPYGIHRSDSLTPKTWTNMFGALVTLCGVLSSRVGTNVARWGNFSSLRYILLLNTDLIGGSIGSP
jgi:hypothetical protein